MRFAVEIIDEVEIFDGVEIFDEVEIFYDVEIFDEICQKTDALMIVRSLHLRILFKSLGQCRWPDILASA